jgi:RNA polymerase sigma-70 factor, ECF subfamily
MADVSRQVEQELVAAAAAGDRVAAERLVREYLPGVYGFIYRMCGRAEIAEDVAQEAFIRAMTHLSSFNPEYRFSTWLYTIARRVYFNMREKRSPVLADLEFAESSGGLVGGMGGGQRSHAQGAAEIDAVDDMEEQSERRSALMRALKLLPEKQREIIVLFHQCGWSVELIATELALPRGTVKSHLHRARIRLRELIELEEAQKSRDIFEIRGGPGPGSPGAEGGPERLERDGIANPVVRARQVGLSGERDGGREGGRESGREGVGRPARAPVQHGRVPERDDGRSGELESGEQESGERES